jgi:hypothetical protein
MGYLELKLKQLIRNYQHYKHSLRGTISKRQIDLLWLLNGIQRKHVAKIKGTCNGVKGR